MREFCGMVWHRVAWYIVMVLDDILLKGWRMAPVGALRQGRQQSANDAVTYHVVFLRFLFFFFNYEYIFLLASSPVSGQVVQDSGI